MVSKEIQYHLLFFFLLIPKSSPVGQSPTRSFLLTFIYAFFFEITTPTIAAMDKSIATTKPEMWLLSPVFTAPPSAGFSFLLFVPFAFAVTFKAYSAVLSPTFAVIFTFPAFTALTTPFASTVATFVSELLHTTVLSSVVFVGLNTTLSFVVFPSSREVTSPLISIDSSGISSTVIS